MPVGITLVLSYSDLIVLVSMKKKIWRITRLYQKTNMGKNNIESTKGSTQLIVWWIVGTKVWGIVSMTLIVGWFFINIFG